MGKSDKKVKSDRINALRKQYDAFLEDDKKRKERNEYILEKLDKMRCCTAMVQVRQKAPIYVDSRKVPLYNMHEQTLESPTGFPHNNVDTPKRVEETVILQEISKKYILIPKLRPSYPNEYSNKAQLKMDEHLDWKSKYDILDQLKRDEKEQDSPVRQETSLLASNVNAISKMCYKENDIKQDEEPLLKYQNELPVKLPPEDQIPYELQGYTEDNKTDQNHLNDKNAADTPYCDNLQNVVYEANGVSNPLYDDGGIKSVVDNQNVVLYPGHDQDNINNFTYDQIPSKDVVDLEYSITQESNLNHDKNDVDVETLKHTSVALSDEYNLHPEHQNIYAQDEPTAVIAESIGHEDLVDKEEENNNIVGNQVYLDQGELAHNIDYTDMINEINHELSPNDATVLTTNVELPIDAVNIQEFTPQDDVQLVEGENVSPKPQLVVANDITQHYDPAIDPANQNIHEETFNTEQNEQFYTEQTENYDYNKQGITENYNTDTLPTENYQQNEEYAYYEGAQPEQPYAEINENEEITQQYDQNYEQQYGTEYNQQAYEQQGYGQEYAQSYDQQAYAEPDQQYETQNQIQEDIQYDNQDNLTPQHVEQKLDSEEGYVEDANATTEDRQVDLEQLQNVAATADHEAKAQ